MGISPQSRERLHLAIATALVGALLAQLMLAARAQAQHRAAQIDERIDLLRRHNELMRENNAMRDALDLAAEKAKPAPAMKLVDELNAIDEQIKPLEDDAGPAA